MFGYVRPLRDELKCRDFDLYRAVYCGLCAAMRRRYGWLAPMFLNYDFTFLALLLAPPEEAFSPCRGRCHANPLRKKTMDQPTPALDTAADESVVLTWWQLRDRAMEQLLYHLGRWIYLLDAQDDLEEDRAAGRYNPVAARFGPEGDPDAMARTLDHSRNLMYSAAQLADFGCRWPLIENILYLGLPLVQRAVFDGSWKQIQKQKIWRSST